MSQLVSVLVVGDRKPSQAKIDKAKALRIPIINNQDFNRLFPTEV
jgi:BRCT domain type II-containing protein